MGEIRRTLPVKAHWEYSGEVMVCGTAARCRRIYYQMQKRLNVFDPLVDEAIIGATDPSIIGATGPSGPTGPISTIPGPQGATGPTSAIPGPQGATGPASTVPGPQGATGPASTIPGPQGATGPASTVPGPQGATGPASTVPGPQGATGVLSTSQVAQLLQNHTITGGGTVTIRNVGGPSESAGIRESWRCL